MFSRPKIFLYLGVGIIAFVFFGFFFPILILPAPIEERFSLVNRPTPAPLRSVSLIGSEIVDRSLGYISVSPLLTTLQNVRCFKDRRGQEGVCKLSSATDYLPAYLIEIYNDPSIQARTINAGAQAEDIASALLASCYRNSDVCRHSFVSFYRRYQETHDPRYLEALTRVGTQLVSGYTRSALSFGGDIYKLLLLYDLTHDQAYLTEALARYDESAAISREDSDDPVIYHDTTLDSDIRRFDCGIYGNVSLSLYQATGENKYLDASRKFFSSMPRYSNRFGHLSALNLCLDGLSALASDLDDERFIAQLKDTLTYGLHAYWDTPETPKFTRDYAMILRDYTTDLTNQTFNFKFPTEHAWFLSHVVKFPDATFQLSGSNL